MWVWVVWVVWSMLTAFIPTRTRSNTQRQVKITSMEARHNHDKLSLTLVFFFEQYVTYVIVVLVAAVLRVG